MSFATVSSTLDTLRSDFKSIQAQQAANSFFSKVTLPKTDERVQQAIEYFRALPNIELTDKNIKKLLAKLQPSPTKSKLILENTGTKDLQWLALPMPLVFFPTCWSSRRMSELMHWRNEESTGLRSIVSITKKVVTEAALPLLTLSSVVEAVATNVLIMGAKLFKRPIGGLQEYAKSAQFTSVWSVSTLWHNIRQKSLPVFEVDARRELFKGYFAV